MMPFWARAGAAIRQRERDDRRTRGALEQRTQDALKVAAVLGREFDFDLLNGSWGNGEEATLAALDDLLRQRLVGEISPLAALLRTITALPITRISRK